jgi:hypothetical protein
MQKIMSGAAGKGLGTTPRFCAAGVSQPLKFASTTPRSYSTAEGIGLCTTHETHNTTTSGAAGNGLYTTIRYMRGAGGIGLGTTIKYLRRTTSAAANNGLGTTIKYLVN